MTEFPDTRDTLLLKIRSAENRQAWEQFVLIYQPVIYRLARQRGLQDADAQDLAQRVLMSIAAAIGDWEKQSPPVRFRHWLRRVARNAIVNALVRQPKDRGAGGSVAVHLLAEHADIDAESAAEVELEYRRELYLRAMRVVRGDVAAETWRAFELTVIESWSIEAAAKELNMQPGAIYAARSRVMRRLREAIRNLEIAEP